jgi:hypothetical protein
VTADTPEDDPGVSDVGGAVDLDGTVDPDVETALDRALGRVARERDRLEEKQAAFERFQSAVASVAADTPSGPATATSGVGTGVGAGAGAAWTRSATGGGDGDDALREVRRAFVEHVQPYGGDAEEQVDTVDEAIATELSAEVAAVLAGGAGVGGGFPPPVKRAIASETDRRLRELSVTARALERERESLADARETVEPVVGWFVAHDDVPLGTVGFDELAARHRRIGDLRGRLDELAARRSDHVRASTGSDGAVGIEHRSLVEYLYAGFECTYPALGTVARLGDLCADARRAVRDHLVRRV